MNRTQEQIDFIKSHGITEYDMDQMYADMLDECYPELKIAGYSYCTSRALEAIDPVAYNCRLADFCSEYSEFTIHAFPPSESCTYYLSEDAAFEYQKLECMPL